MSSGGSDITRSSSGSADDRSIGIIDQIHSAIRAGELETVLEILSSPAYQEHGLPVRVTDDYIDKALQLAGKQGQVVACRFLWGKLSSRGKKFYLKATIDVYDPLHKAAQQGQLQVVRLFIEEFKWNINQRNSLGKTPLCNSVKHLEIARFLLENGANPNLCSRGGFSPLWFAVNENRAEVCRLLLMYQADPNLNRIPADEEDANARFRNTDLAIEHGNAEILRMLLEHGAFTGGLLDRIHGTSLNRLLRSRQIFVEVKNSICRVLLEYAQEDSSTAAFIQVSLECAMQHSNSDVECRRLLDAGVDPRMFMYCAVRAESLSICQLLVNAYRVDPFSEEDGDNDDDRDETKAASPFLAASRLADTSIFEYFLGIWNERFASTGGKNGDGDYPLHVACCDPLVSLQAIKLLINRQADVLAKVDGGQGLLPFHFAANWGASLDVIFCLLQHCPDALRHVGNAGSASIGPDPSSSTTSGSTNGTIEAGIDEGDKQEDAPAKKNPKQDLPAKYPFTELPAYEVFEI